MEVAEKKIPWLDENHPNFLRWQRARNISIERGKFVKSILDRVTDCNGLTILDLGSGEGGTTKVLSENNRVISFDISKDRLLRQDNSIKLCGDASTMSFKEESFDIIILQDVIEHLPDKKILPGLFYNLVKEKGFIYLSTPNKLSILNFLSDPHWGVPIVSVLSREKIKKYFLHYFRKSEFKRNDVAELFSLKELQELFGKNFSIQMFTKHTVKELFGGNRGIVWSDFHLRIIKITSLLKLDKIIQRIANDKFGLLNKFLTPTFYLILKKN